MQYNLQILCIQLSEPLCPPCGLTTLPSFLCVCREVKKLSALPHICSPVVLNDWCLEKILWHEHLSSSSLLADPSAILIFPRYQLTGTHGAVPVNLWLFHFISHQSIKLNATQKTFRSLWVFCRLLAKMPKHFPEHVLVMSQYFNICLCCRQYLCVWNPFNFFVPSIFNATCSF